MAITVFPVTEHFAAEIGDVDLSRPLADEEVAAIKQAFWDYAVLIFPDQELTEDSISHSPNTSGRWKSVIAALNKGKLRLRPELADVSNLNRHNKIWHDTSRLRGLAVGNQLWHTDSSFKYLPARASLLYARSIPPVGGHTHFADMRAAYDALPEAMQRPPRGTGRRAFTRDFA